MVPEDSLVFPCFFPLPCAPLSVFLCVCVLVVCVCVCVLAWAWLSWLPALHSWLQSAHHLSQSAHLPLITSSACSVYIPWLFIHSSPDRCFCSSGSLHLRPLTYIAISQSLDLLLTAVSLSSAPGPSLACLPACQLARSPAHYHLLPSASPCHSPSLLSVLQSSASACFIPTPSTSIPPLPWQ